MDHEIIAMWGTDAEQRCGFRVHRLGLVLDEGGRQTARPRN